MAWQWGRGDERENQRKKYWKQDFFVFFFHPALWSLFHCFRGSVSCHSHHPYVRPKDKKMDKYKKNVYQELSRLCSLHPDRTFNNFRGSNSSIIELYVVHKLRFADFVTLKCSVGPARGRKMLVNAVAVIFFSYILKFIWRMMFLVAIVRALKIFGFHWQDGNSKKVCNFSEARKKVYVISVFFLPRLIMTWP